MSGPTPTERREPRFVVEVLGPCRVVDRATGTAPELSPIQRRLLGRLARSAPDAVTFDDLADAVWGTQVPATFRAALTNQVSRLRSRFGPELIATAAEGYSLGVPTDLGQVADYVDDAERALLTGDFEAAGRSATAALERFRSHLGDEQPRDVTELRMAAENLRLRAALATGRTGWAVPEAERLVANSPYDEQRWELLARALEAAGRRGDALGAIDRARRALAQGLGLGLGAPLRAVEANLLGSPAAPRVRIEVPVARESVRPQLRDVVTSRLTSGRSVILIGEVGIGKSVVLDAAVRAMRASGARVARASCAPHPDVPLAVLDDLLDDLGERLGRVADPVAEFIATIDTVASAAGPLVVAVDDAHLAGPTSVRALLRATARPGVVVLATSAPPGPDLRTGERADPIDVIDVPHLEADEVCAVATALLGRPVPAAGRLAEWLVEMSGGNPAILELLVSMVGDDDEPPSDRAPSPELRDLVRRRMARLSADERHGLAVLAVHGQPMERDLLAAVAGHRCVPEASAGGLVTWDAGAGGAVVRFRQRAVSDAVYDDVPPGHRAEIGHRLAVELRARGAAPAQVARHSAAAGVAPRDAWDDAVSAGVAYSARGAHREAAHWYAVAAEAASALGTEGEPERVDALIRHGDALRLAGDRQQEAALLSAADAAVASGVPELIGRAACAALKLGAASDSGELNARALALAQTALEVVTDPELWAQVAASTSLARSLTEGAEQGRELFVRAEQLARRRETRLEVLPLAYLALGHPVDLDARERATTELIRLAEAVDDPIAAFEGYQLDFSVAVQRGDGGRVRAALDAMRTLIDRTGQVGQAWAVAYVEAAVAHLDDRLDESERWAEEALNRFGQVAPARAFAAYGGQLLALRIAQGRVDELTDSLQGLVAEQPGVPAWNAALALALTETDPAEAARSAWRALADVPADFLWLAAHVIGGRAAARVGDAELVAAYRARLEPWSGLVCWQGTCSYGPVDTPLASLAEAAGDRVAAARHRDRARALADSLAAPVFARELSVGA